MKKFLLAAYGCVAMLGGLSLSAQTPSVVTSSPTILDVPYLPQSSLLCGGAALAMVERWWGKRGVYAEDFASFVHEDEGGIRTTDMSSAANIRGWQTRLLTGADVVQSALADSLPVVALIEVAPKRYHYVVLLAWSDGRVVLHDPAGAPRMSFTEKQFLAQWRGANSWALLLTPADSVAEARPPIKFVFDSMPCSPWIDRAIDATNEQAFDRAAALLDSARTACPDEALVMRELAGVRFREGKYAEAMRLTTAYLARQPDDSLAWQLLATSRYLTGDTFGALTAWNRFGHPTLDLTRVDGDLRFTFQTLSAAVAIAPGSVLTGQQLLLAQRRIAEIPALQRSALTLFPVGDGLAELHLGVSQKPLMMSPRSMLISNVVRAVGRDEVAIEVASPARVGELWGASWRWQRARPRLAFRLDIPTRFGVPGVFTLTGAREQMRIDRGDTRELIEESRGTTGVGYSAWLTSSLRLTGTVELEKWNGRRQYLAMGSSAIWLTHRDHIQVALSSTQGVALSRSTSYHHASVRSSWKSATRIDQTTFAARSGFDWISNGAPTGAWPIAGGNLPWAVQLRAHSATRHDALDGSLVGRGVAHAGVSADHPISRIGPLILAGGVFLDAARIVHAADTTQTRSNYLDGGLGLRVGVVGMNAQLISVDLARDLLRSGGWRVSVGVRN